MIGHHRCLVPTKACVRDVSNVYPHNTHPFIPFIIASYAETFSAIFLTQIFLIFLDSYHFFPLSFKWTLPSRNVRIRSLALKTSNLKIAASDLSVPQKGPNHENVFLEGQKYIDFVRWWEKWNDYVESHKIGPIILLTHTRSEFFGKVHEAGKMSLKCCQW